MIKQLSVFLENDKGRLSSMCNCLGEAGINMVAMTVAETSNYGIIRLVCDTPEKAADALSSAGFIVRSVEVAAVSVSDQAGGLAKLLDAFEEAEINVEYAYCFANNSDKATAIIKIDPIEKAQEVVEGAGFSCIAPEEVYALD